MRYRLRTLLILLAVIPPLLWLGWMKYQAWRAERELIRARREWLVRISALHSSQALGDGLLKLLREAESPEVSNGITQP